MNVLEEKVMDWSQQQFNIKIQTKDSLKNGEQIKRFYYSNECQNDLKIIENEIKEIKSKMSDIRNKLLAETLNQKSIEIKEKLKKNKEFISRLILNAIENISAKNKLCTQLKPNLKTINETIASYENIFTPNEELDPQTNECSDETPNMTTNAVLSLLLEQINQLMVKINSILYDLCQMEVHKPIKISIDSESVSKCLVESMPKIHINSFGEEKDNKSSAINSKLVSVQNLMNKYQTIRSEKLSKNKEKLEKVINSCDEFIRQNV